LQCLLAKTAFQLREPWLIGRRGCPDDEWRDWNQRCAARVKESSRLLEEYARWAATANKNASVPSPEKEQKSWRTRFTLWRRQDRAVDTLLEIEIALCELGVTWFAATRDFVDSVRQEREHVLAQVARTLEWIRSGAESAGAPLEAVLELVSPEERLSAWVHPIETESCASLPERAEIVIPGRYPRWRSVRPRHAFSTAFDSYARSPMPRIVEDYWNQSAAIVRELARAREIVDYWRGASPAAAVDAQSLFSDACHSAADMLAVQIQTPMAVEALESRLLQAVASWSDEGVTHTESALLGLAVLLQRPRGRELLARTFIRAARRKTTEAAALTGHWVSDRLDRTLESLGDKIPTHPKEQPVVRRTTLRDTLALPASKIANLPPVYRLLFRVAPVEDRRFLVGRNRELAGLLQAVKDWEEGRFAACLIVGARGSGKTSLLNCAAKEAFAGHTLVRGQFADRAMTNEHIDALLRTLLAVKENTSLETALAAERRILVLEEFERSYMRKVGGFEGARYMMRLIHRTASTTLWIIGVNDRALRVLDAVGQFHRGFSHRFNATSLSREDLEKAILERHRLSGLSLEFAPPPPEDPRVSRVKSWVGLQDSPQKLFFDSLFQQSEGILRSAFELWLSSIDRVERGTLKIRQPLDPAFGALRNELAQEDHFTLLAIQEHGSLKHDELAEILGEAGDASRSRMDRLAALGLIEPDPEHAGLRVRPEAQRFTNDLLGRANLT
jgi:hypothetical protein